MSTIDEIRRRWPQGPNRCGYCGRVKADPKRHDEEGADLEKARADAAEATCAELRQAAERLETERGNWRDIGHREIERCRHWRDRHIGTLLMLAFDSCISQDRAREIAEMSVAEFRDFAAKWVEKNHAPAPDQPDAPRPAPVATEGMREAAYEAFNDFFGSDYAADPDAIDNAINAALRKGREEGSI
jgi:hypothetical protein